MGRIITRELLERAIELARPTAEMILCQPDAIWGPSYGTGRVLFEDIEVEYVMGHDNGWKPSASEPTTFGPIAVAKAAASGRTGKPTRLLVHGAPHLLLEGEYLYIGSVTWEGITVSFSGACSEADEAIALVVLATIKMLIYLDTRYRVEAGENQI